MRVKPGYKSILEDAVLYMETDLHVITDPELASYNEGFIDGVQFAIDTWVSVNADGTNGTEEE